VLLGSAQFSDSTMAASMRLQSNKIASVGTGCRRSAVIVRAEKFTVTKPTLIDAPVSNHGARVI
jgi:hypothetical protein